MAISITDLNSNLCAYDPRNPWYALAYGSNPDPDDAPPSPREPMCGCDNCFYRRDEMASRLLQLHEAGVSGVVG